MKSKNKYAKAHSSQQEKDRRKHQIIKGQLKKQNGLEIQKNTTNAK